MDKTKLRADYEEERNKAVEPFFNKYEAKTLYTLTDFVVELRINNELLREFIAEFKKGKK